MYHHLNFILTTCHDTKTHPNKLNELLYVIRLQKLTEMSTSTFRDYYIIGTPGDRGFCLELSSLVYSDVSS